MNLEKRNKKFNYGLVETNPLMKINRMKKTLPDLQFKIKNVIHAALINKTSTSYYYKLVLTGKLTLY